MYYFGIDIETTGQFLNKNAIIAIGCVVINEKGEELETFESYLKIPDGRVWEERCVNEFWSKNEDTLSFIKMRMKNPIKEMILLEEWLNKIDLKYGSELVVLSDNPSFDFAWIDTYLHIFTDRPSIYYRLKTISDQGEREYGYRRVWDTNSVYHGALMQKNREIY